LTRVVITFGQSVVMVSFLPDSIDNIPPIHFDMFVASDDPDDPTLAADWWKKPQEDP
jgi:hypothetical protein